MKLSMKGLNLKEMESKFKKLTIRKKLYNSFIILSFIGMISGLIFIQKTTNEYNYALINYGFSQGDIGKLGIEIEKSNSLVRDTLFLSDPNEQNDVKKSLNSSLDKIDELLTIISTSITTDTEKENLNKIKTNLAKYKQVRSTVVIKGMANDRDEGLKIFRTQGLSLMNKISDDISLLLQTKIDVCNQLSNRLTILKFASIITVLITMIASVILSLFLAKYITKQISDPIDNMKNVAEEMANGNLDVSINITSNDEISQLSSSFSQMRLLL